MWTKNVYRAYVLHLTTGRKWYKWRKRRCRANGSDWKTGKYIVVWINCAHKDKFHCILGCKDRNKVYVICSHSRKMACKFLNTHSRLGYMFKKGYNCSVWGDFLLMPRVMLVLSLYIESTNSLTRGSSSTHVYCLITG